MSFFGFIPRHEGDQFPTHQGRLDRRGMFEQHDPFGGLSGASAGNDDEMLDFDQTYDGLGQQLDESGDTFNDDTFGGDEDEPLSREALGNDFDFAGQTAQMREELLEEHALHQARQPMLATQQPSKPMRTGYEQYKEPSYIPKLEADASIWGKPAKKVVEQRSTPQDDAAAASGRKMMSLEEVEAIMRAQAKPTPPPAPPSMEAQSQGLREMLGVGLSVPSPLPSQDRLPTPKQQQQQLQQQQLQQLQLQQQQQQQRQEPPRPMHILQRPRQPSPGVSLQQPFPQPGLRAPHVLQRQHSPLQQGQRPPSQDQQGQLPYPTAAQHPIPMPGGAPIVPPTQDQQGQPPHPIAAQQPVPMPGGAPIAPPTHPRAPMQPISHNRGPSYNGPPITQAQQLMVLTAEEREAYLVEEAKRAKRNHKIFLLSKDNGLMTPQDKNFITRIQLQQLLTATGGIDNEPGSEEQLAEDFYYQVYAQIRGPPRSGPGQPLNQFAQTYLFQTGSRYGYGRSRHHPRGGDNHVQRMEQQVARAVEAAKARPKNKSLVVEGSLGKIAFSNSKTPRPLLNIKRHDSEARLRHTSARTATVADRKATLRDIERLYTTLMRLEDHERNLPSPPNEESPPEVIEGHMKWRTEMQELNQQLWEASKVLEPIQSNPSSPHPFIQILSHSKGKKAIPRVFRHLDEQQRLTMLTLIAIHLDSLDVVRDAYPPAENAPLPARVRDEVDTFNQAVMPPLFTYVNDAPLNIIIGLLGLVLDRVHVQALARTKIGLAILTMLVSRAELVAQALPAQPSPSEADDKAQWAELYGRLFDAIEPVLPLIFPTDTSVPAADDVHVWQFLAAMGVGASPDQQQRLVLGVKDRVMETVAVSKALPEEMANRRLGEVNLFMRAIGLDVELLG